MKKIILPAFFAIFGIAVLEIITYFVFIYRPFEQIANPERGYVADLPGVSQLLTPQVIAESTISFADEPKSFYLNGLDLFRKTAESTLTNESSFVKNASVDYIIAGQIWAINEKSDDSFEITLTNSKNEKTLVSLAKSEWTGAKTVLIYVNPDSPQASDISLKDAEKGDYLILKVERSLITADNPIKYDIEVLRLPSP